MNTKPSQTCPQCGAPLSPNAPAGLCPRCLMEMNLATHTEMDEDDARGRTRPRAPSPEEIAAFFPQLEILECLGQGGMGVVYKARQRELGRVVALKILPREIGETPGFAERFTREARALAKLNHPNIVTLYEFGRVDAGEDEGSQPLYFFLMEYVDGLNLRRLLNSRRVEPREALAIVPQICDALQYAHDECIVHRDIKPENILMDRRGNVKVADFGLAKIVEGGDGPEDAERTSGHTVPDDLTEAGKVMGTPKYMSPEQVTAPGEVDHRADIYALGVVFYQMLTGELPDTPLQRPSAKVQIDVRLDEVVLRALEQAPERRYQQASILKTQIETIAIDTEPVARPDTATDATTFPLISFCLAVVYIGCLALSILFSLLFRDPMSYIVAFLVSGGPLAFWSAFSAKRAVPEKRRLMLKIGSVLSIITSIPAVILSALFIKAMAEETGGWNPGAEEAFFVTMALIGSVLLPVCAWRMLVSLRPARTASDSPTRRSRAAVVGAAWIGVFFLNWGVAYTPPGWALTQFFRGTSLNLLVELFLLLPLMVLGYGAVVGGSVMGVVALHHIRKGRGTVGGIGLALFDLLFFPLILLSWWTVWLGRSVLSLAGWDHHFWLYLGLAACVAIDVWLVAATKRAAVRFVQTPAPPARPPVSGTWPQVIKSSLLRLVLVVVVQLALLETLHQVATNWRESTGELWSIALAVATLGGLAWACWPGWRLKRSWGFCLGGVVITSLLLLGLNNFYAWHVRPNLGLYQEPAWVAEHPGFQQTQREAVAKNSWGSRIVVANHGTNLVEVGTTGSDRKVSIGLGGMARFRRSASVVLGNAMIRVRDQLEVTNKGTDTISVTHVDNTGTEQDMLLGPGGTGHFSILTPIRIGDVTIRFGREKSADVVGAPGSVSPGREVVNHPYLGTSDIDEFVDLFSAASSRGDRTFVETMILREALNQGEQEGAVALIVPDRPTELSAVTVESVDRRLREKPESFDHLPAGVEPRHILYAKYKPEVGSHYSIDYTKYFPVVEKDGVLYIGAFQRSKPTAHLEEAGFAEGMEDASFVLGPVTERVISRFDASEQGFVCLDVETGKTHRPPFPLLRRKMSGSLTSAELTPEFMDWVEATGADYLFHLEDERWSLTPLKLEPMLGNPLVEEDVADLSPADVAFVEAGSETRDVHYPVPVVNLPYREDAPFNVPFCMGFITADGTQGFLQRMGIETLPVAVRVRYRLVEPSRKGSAGGIPGSDATSHTVRFGPVIERTVYDQWSPDGSNCIDLDSGKLITMSEPKEADFAWILRNGIDAMAALDGTASEGLMGTGGMVVQKVQNERWHTIQPAEIVSSTIWLEPDFGISVALVDPASEVGKPVLPVTFLFRTREGGMGILQVLEHTKDPGGVKIRYKLAEGTGTESAQTQVDTIPSGPTDSTESAGGDASARPPGLKFNIRTGSHRTLVDPRDEGSPSFVDLARRRVAEAPVTLPPLDAEPFHDAMHNTDWRGSLIDAAREHNLDVAADPLGHSLVGFDLSAERLLEHKLWNMPPEEAVARLKAVGPPPETVRLSEIEGKPSMWMFRTREGVCGMLSIVDVHEHNGKISVLFKYIQEGSFPYIAEEGAAPHAPQFRWVAEDRSTEPTELWPDPSKRTSLRLLREVVMDGRDIAGAAVSPDGGSSPSINVTLTEEGRIKFEEATANNIGRRLAIVWNGRVLSAPTVKMAIDGGQVDITGRFTDAEQEQLLNALNPSAVSEPVRPLMELDIPEETLPEDTSREGYRLSVAPYENGYVLAAIREYEGRETVDRVKTPPSREVLRLLRVRGGTHSEDIFLTCTWLGNRTTETDPYNGTCIASGFGHQVTVDDLDYLGEGHHVGITGDPNEKKTPGYAAVQFKFTATEGDTSRTRIIDFELKPIRLGKAEELARRYRLSLPPDNVDNWGITLSAPADETGGGPKEG